MLVRSEYSFREVYGKVDAIIGRLDGRPAALADWGAWGHVSFAGPGRVLGTRVGLVPTLDPGARPVPVTLIPRTGTALAALYEAITLAYSQFYRVPRLLPGQLAGQDWEILSFTPGIDGAHWVYRPEAVQAGQTLASSDNLYPAPEDRPAWLFLAGRAARTGTAPGHILTDGELRLAGATRAQLSATRALLEACDTPLPKATNIRYGVPDPDLELRRICELELRARRLPNEYGQRLERELGLIADKKFADYFLVIADLIRYAKQHMLVGPARGSSAGSLVCWLTRITEIDPIRFELLFERFVDVNRFDLPDIDIDFPDEKRHMVMAYLVERYGAAHVAHIGTVLRFKAKSALTTVAKELGVPLYELDKLKDVLIERASGDARAGQCLEDSMLSREIGRELLERHPALATSFKLEDHAFSSGVHAAGLIVCNEPVTNYCAIGRESGAQIDKKMAEKLNMLKIDALGLRTLTVIETACALAGIDPAQLYNVDVEDQKVFSLLNRRKYSGVFQFEGIALQGVASQFNIDCFNDIVAITALARPGPLASGETANWLDRKTGKARVEYSHPALEPYCRETLGAIMYQEQVMQITRNIGNFSWADTAAIRKLMSSRQGDEKFQKFELAFIAGATSNGVPERDAKRIWKAIHTFGSWAFNKSHAVAYGLLSYWTAWVKTHHPLPFAVAALRHSRDDDSTMVFLREILREGDINYVPLHPEHSEESWTFKDDKLYGGLMSVKGCGAKTAREIIVRRKNGVKLTGRQLAIVNGQSKFADPFPAHRLWGDLYAHPDRHFKTVDRVDEISQLAVGQEERAVIIGKMVRKDLRDLNAEERYLARRGGKLVPETERYMALFYVEDDSGRILCFVNAKLYEKIGRRIIEQGAIGDWFAVSGKVGKKFVMLDVENVKWLKLV